MHTFYFKNEGEKNPDHPNRDPERAIAEQVGQERLKNIPFESDGQRRDYERAVNSNPNNVMGLSPFYPPEKIRVFMGGLENKPKPMPRYTLTCPRCRGKFYVEAEEWIRAKQKPCPNCETKIEGIQ